MSEVLLSFENQGTVRCSVDPFASRWSALSHRTGPFLRKKREDERTPPRAPPETTMGIPEVLWEFRTGRIVQEDLEDFDRRRCEIRIPPCLCSRLLRAEGVEL